MGLRGSPYDDFANQFWFETLLHGNVVENGGNRASDYLDECSSIWSEFLYQIWLTWFCHDENKRCGNVTNEIDAIWTPQDARYCVTFAPRSV